MLVIVWSHVWSWNETQVTGKPTCSAREEAKSRGPPDAMLLLMVSQNCPFVSLVFFRGTLCLLVHNPYELQRYVIYIYTYLPQILVCQNWGISWHRLKNCLGPTGRGICWKLCSIFSSKDCGSHEVGWYHWPVRFPWPGISITILWFMDLIQYSTSPAGHVLKYLLWPLAGTEGTNA